MSSSGTLPISNQFLIDMNKIIIFTSILLLASAQFSTAQEKLGAFVGAGTMWYSGDLQNTVIPHPLTIRWTANAGLIWQADHRWGLQLNYTIGEIIGLSLIHISEPTRLMRNTYAVKVL